MAAPTPEHIVLIDDDPALLELLARLLSGPERTVETVCGGNGLAVDLLALAAPRVVIMNPNSNGLTVDSAREMIRGLRRATRASIVLMVDGSVDPKATAARLGADAGVELRVFLRDPLARLQGHKILGPTPVSAPRLPTVDALGASDILELELVEPVSPPPLVAHVELSETEVLRSSPAITDLAGLIDEELAHFKPAPTASTEFTIALDTIGEDAIYVSDDRRPLGVFVASTLPVFVGDRVTLNVSFPWGYARAWPGVVAWIAPQSGLARRRRPGFGVEVTQLSEPDRVAISRLAGLRVPMPIPRGVKP
jgi:CheY-like chemotaxis protein